MYNPENERIKRAFFVYLKEARRLGEHSIDGAAAALAKFEDYTKYRDFKRFHIQQAIGFKNRLSEHISPRTGERLSRGTVFSTLNALRGFFQWLSTKPGYRSHLSSADAEYFALSEREARIAKAIAERPVPTIEQIRHVLQTMPAGNDIELRNRSVVAFTALTGARDGAIASIGPMPRRSGPFSRRPSPAPGSPTPIHILSARRWRNSANAYAGHPRTSRLGATTSGTSRF